MEINWWIVGVMSYLLIGMLMIDTILVKTYGWEYWFILFLWPILLIGMIWIGIVLSIVIKLYEIGSKIK